MSVTLLSGLLTDHSNLPSSLPVLDFCIVFLLIWTSFGCVLVFVFSFSCSSSTSLSLLFFFFMRLLFPRFSLGGGSGGLFIFLLCAGGGDLGEEDDSFDGVIDQIQGVDQI